jgi:hypothetical protein
MTSKIVTFGLPERGSGMLPIIGYARGSLWSPPCAYPSLYDKESKRIMKHVRENYPILTEEEKYHISKRLRKCITSEGEGYEMDVLLGITDETRKPLRCWLCWSNDIFVPFHGPNEYDVKCKQCKVTVGCWSYGHWE